MNRNTLIAAIALLIASLAMGCGTATAPAVTPASTTGGSVASEVSVTQAAELIDSGAFVVDVREPIEWTRDGHIAGATLIPLGELTSRIDELPTDRTIVVVCRSGNRSSQGRFMLRTAGLMNSTSMAGGMNDWIAQGLPVVTGE